MNRREFGRNCSLTLAMLSGAYDRTLFGQPAAEADALPDPGPLGTLRVCLSDEPFSGIHEIRCTHGGTLTGAGQTKPLHRVSRDSIISLERKAAQWWIGTKAVPGEVLELSTPESPGLWIGNRLYRGSLRVIPFDRQRFWIINILPLEHYLCSVIDGEIPGQFHNEARKAQAVAARTYALRRRAQNQNKDYDVWASPTRDQNYHGFQYRDRSGKAFAGESAKSRRAVRETAGQVLTRDGDLARTYYSACCGGTTSAGTTTFPDAADMQSVHCGHCQDCPRYRWRADLTSREILSAVRKCVGKSAPGSLEIERLEIRDATDRTRLPELAVTLREGRSFTIDSRAFRAALSRTDLFSVWFELHKDKDQWRAEGIGHGHGVGLCQWGAHGFASEGKTHEEILTHYYPGARVTDFRV